MPILHSKTTLNRPPRILQSENANSVLKIEILCSENANLRTQQLQWFSKKTGQNSALRKWKFCPQEMQILQPKMEILYSKNGKFSQSHGKLTFLHFFHDKSGNLVLPCSSQNLNSAIIAESGND